MSTTILPLPPSTKHIGDRSLSLAQHLRATVNLLLDQERSGYSWASAATCNAGLLARTMLGCTEETLRATVAELRRSDRVRSPAWCHMMTDVCPHNPGEQWPDLFKRLIEGGLEPTDPAHLEGLTHPELRDPTWVSLIDNWAAKHVMMLPNGNGAFNNPACVAAYMQRWAERIEAFHAAHPEQPQEAAPESAPVTSADMEQASFEPIKQEVLGR